MFGSLVTTNQNDMLTFVENSDLESALSRTKRPKVHVSCEFCRIRKIKCSGNSSGCTRCVAMGMQCRYPPRESRKRKSTGPKVTETAQPTEGWETPSSKSQSGNEYFMDATENNDMSWAVGEPTIIQPEGNNDMAMAENMFLDFDSEQLQDKLSFLSWNDLDSTSWPSTTDFTPLTSSPMLSCQGDTTSGNIQLDDVQQVLSLPPGDTITNQGSLSRQSSGSRKRARKSSDHSSHHSRRSTSSSPSNTSWSGLPNDTWNNNWSRQSIYNSPTTLEKPKLPESHDGLNINLNLNQGAVKCSCSHRAALFLVELGQINARMEHGSLDMLLGHFREGLRTFGALLECEQCNAAGEGSTLNVVAAQCLGTLCENVVKSYVDTMTMGQDYARQSPTGTGEEMWYSSYSIHDGNERQEVLRCLVSVQVNQFQNWLEKLKARGGNSKKHNFLMTEAEQKVTAASSMLRQHGNPV